MGQEQWYVLYTKPNAEYRVAATLRERGLQAYLPEIESVRARRGGLRKPFFPCYLFARFDFETIGLMQVQWTPGLRRVVAFNNRPVPLADEVIELIQRKLGEKAARDWPAHSFKPGDTFRITDGPLRGMLAIFEGPTTPAERVRVLLTILGRVSRAQVSAAELEQASPELNMPLAKRLRRTRGRGRPIQSD